MTFQVKFQVNLGGQALAPIQECRIKVTCTVTAYNMRSLKIVFSTVEKRIINGKSTIAYQAQFRIGNIQPSFILAIYNLYSDFARDSYLLQFQCKIDDFKITSDASIRQCTGSGRGMIHFKRSEWISEIRDQIHVP